MLLDRRRFAALMASAALAPLSAFGAPGRAAALEGAVTDMAGRRVPLRRPIERIVLLDARDALSMALLHPEPSRLIVGWADVERLDSDLVRRQYERRPGGEGAVAVVGGQAGDTISLEGILALAPDLVVATAFMEPGLGDGVLTRRLQAAGIPVVFGNVASNRGAGAEAADDPFGDLARLMRMWGSILGRADAAEVFIAFVEDRLARIRGRLAAARPAKTYLEVQSTYDDCCWAAGSRVWGDLLALAGGRGLSAATAPWYAKVGVEQLMTEAPEVYIASGGAYGAGIRPAIGPGLDPGQGRDGLRRLVRRTGFATLPAVRDGRVHGIWTGLIAIQPLNILFVEAAAGWLHPERFRDVDPEATLAEINRRFLAAPLPGPCWLSLGE